MSYIALYRAFRPQQFSEVVGQEHVSKTLKNALINNRVAHAYLFCGPRGTGKTSSAKILAKAVNCLNLQEGEPCNECDNCTSINSGNFLDVYEIDAASNRGIDEIRDIRDKVKFAPSQGKVKVYIIDEVHMLTSEAFNALLKTLEEPPKHVLFVLATTEPKKIPLTILSRCQRFDFRKISTNEIKEHLNKIVVQEGISISDSALNIIARKAAGGMRDAISVLDQCIAFAGNEIKNEHVEKVLGTLGEEQIIKISEGIINGDAGLVLGYLNDYLQSGKDVKEITRDLIEHFRDILLLKLSKNEGLLNVSKEMLTNIREQSNRLSINYLGEIIKKLTDAEKELRWSSQPQILLEASLVDIVFKEKILAKEKVTSVVEVETDNNSQKNEEIQKNREVQKNEEVKGGNSVELQEIKRLWPEVLERVKKKKVTTHAFLVVATPYKIEKENLFLFFKEINKFHRDKIKQPENIKIIEAAIKEIIGTEIKLSLLLEGEENNKVDSSTNQSIVEQAIEIFGGNIVKVKD